MALWRCYSQHGMELIESDQTPTNSARQCTLEVGDPGETPDLKPFDTRAYLPPGVANEALGQMAPGPNPSKPQFRINPIGPTPDDPFSDPSMAEVTNPPRSPVTNLLQGPWAGKTTVTSNGGINPKFNFGSDDSTESDQDKTPNPWLWLLILAAALYAWNRLR